MLQSYVEELSSGAYLHMLDVITSSCIFANTVFAVTANALFDFARIRVPWPRAEPFHTDVAIKV